MSVVIKGFDKPSDCDYCTLQDDGYCNVLLSYINVEHGIDTRCPITEISEYKLKNGHRVVVAEQTEPQKDCKKCKNYDRCKNNHWKCCVYQPKDEPQTDCAWRRDDD